MILFFVFSISNPLSITYFVCQGEVKISDTSDDRESVKNTRNNTYTGQRGRRLASLFKIPEYSIFYLPCNRTI